MRLIVLPPAVLAGALLAGCATPSGPSDEAARLVGTYKVVSYQVLADGQAPIDHWGSPPRGYIVITPQRLTAILTAQERKVPSPPFTAQDLAASFVTQIAYTGPYRLEGNRLITQVDASSAVTMVGTQQPREYRIDGRHLHLSTLHGPLPPLLPHAGKPGRLVLVWERIE